MELGLFGACLDRKLRTRSSPAAFEIRGTVKGKGPWGPSIELHPIARSHNRTFLHRSSDTRRKLQ